MSQSDWDYVGWIFGTGILAGVILTPIVNIIMQH